MAKLDLPFVSSERIIGRPLCLLFPLEVESQEHIESNMDNNNDAGVVRKTSARASSEIARKKSKLFLRMKIKNKCFCLLAYLEV